MISLGTERLAWKCWIARVNSRCVVGTISVPTMVASVAVNIRIWKSQNNASALLIRFSSIRLDRNGAWNELAARETSTSTLNNANDTAILRDRTPAIRAA